MTVSDDLKKAQSAAADIQAGASALHDYSEKSRELAKNSMKLNGAQELLGKTKKFGKLASGLMMANIGIEIALMFLPKSPSPDELILKAIDVLTSKTDGMWSSMTAEFKELEQNQNNISAKSKIAEELDYFAVLQGLISDALSRKEQHIHQDLLDDLYSPSKIYHNFKIIALSLTSPNADENALASNYAASSGSSTVIESLADTYVSIALFAPTAYAMAKALRHDADADVAMPTAEEIALHFDGDAASIGPTVLILNAATAWVDRCHNEMDSNIHACIQHHVDKIVDFGTDQRDDAPSTAYIQPCNDLLAKLEKLWPQVGFWVVMGHKDIGPDNIYTAMGWRYSTSYHINHSAKAHDGGTYMLAVYWKQTSSSSDNSRKNHALIDNINDDITQKHANLGDWEDQGLLHELKKHGAGVTLEALQIANYQPIMSVGAAISKQKNFPWSVATNRMSDLSFYLYPTWNPLTPGNDEETNTKELVELQKTEKFYFKQSLTGSHGLAFMVIG